MLHLRLVVYFLKNDEILLADQDGIIVIDEESLEG